MDTISFDTFKMSSFELNSVQEKDEQLLIKRRKMLQTKGMFLVCAHKSKEFVDLEDDTWI